ncbi:uncharacterized protein [Triticum aestivum]|uniref:uncharacterized protein isoform X2 n=1 Tax=Triticum aestivum TaxID=4565 RepID=UPI001D01C52E|nr:uncharacterized protein LOC123141310 isoform X2 [Triticum aestivum]XP_044416423.1 uncharacterized protein LOC123141310 isoform X2 [Triticum aestivum]
MTWRCNHHTNALLWMRTMKLWSMMKMCTNRGKTLVQIRVLWVTSLHLKMLSVLARQIQNKKQRVYSDSHSQQLGNVGQNNNVMSKENFLYDMEMQPSNKRPSKDKNKDTSIHDENVQQEKENSSANKHGGQNISKVSRGGNATKHANKQQCGATNCLGADSIDVGTIVFFKSLGNPNKNVALGTLQSTNPEYKVEGVHLGNQFWAVRIDATLAKSDQLIRPLKKVNIIGHAAGLIIAWPSTFIAKIN